MVVFILLFALLLLTLIFYLILRKQEKGEIEFFHVMAHRFRSPISIIKWYIELMSDKSAGELNEKQKEYFTEIVNASEKLNETIDSLIILLQLQSNNLNLKIEKIDIKDLIANIIQKLKFKIDRHKIHLLEIYPDGQELTVQSDLKMLNIALQNLIENAVRYSPEDGNIEIEASLSDKKLLIQIRDFGYGIPKEKRSKVLANSVSSKDMSFSLYLIKLIFKKMHATINFKSEEYKGTTFFITLPA
jgi:signal transduction histidine kinase